jgi:MFS family permease
LPVVTAIVAPIAGVISDRIGARLPATLGLIIQALALVYLSRLTPTTPYLQVAGGLAVMGLGGGLFYPPNTSAAMNSAPGTRLGVASATLATFRQVGMVTSFGLALAVAAGSLPKATMMQIFVGTNVSLGSQLMQSFVIGMHSAFLVSFILCLAAALLSAVRGKEERRKVAASIAEP